MKNGAYQNYSYLIPAILLICLHASSFAAPLFSNIETKNIEYLAGSGKVFVTKSISIHADTRYIKSASIRIIAGYSPSEDVLSFKNTSTISGSWDPKTGILTLIGTASISNYQAALRTIMYENTNKTNPSGLLRTVSFTVTDFWGSVSNTVSRNININIPNTAPVLYNIETDPVIWCINSDSLPISSSITISDTNDQYLVSATVRIVSGYHSSEDQLLFVNRDNISGSWNISSGILTLTGQASLQEYTQALRSVRYRNQNNENPAALFHQINFQVNDGRSSSNELSRNIVHIIPTASVSGSDSICTGESGSISIALTGSAPWTFSYVRDGGNAVLVENVIENPVQIPVSNPGIYTLNSMSDKYCPGRLSGSATIIQLPQPAVTLSGLDPVYSRQSTDWIPLTGTPEGGEFSGPGVLPYGNEWFFIPALPSVGMHDIIYKYRESAESCFGFDTVTVKILEKTAAIEITGDRTHFCKNESPVEITGINLINQETGTFSITGGNGLTDHGNNTATVYPSVLAVNHYTITYTAFDGTSVTLEIEIGGELIAGFEWETECFQPGESILLSNKTQSPFGLLDESSFHWTIRGKNDTLTFTSTDPEPLFDEPGIYSIKLEAENSYGCRNELEKAFSLNSVIPLANNNYFENFENLPAWHSENDATYPVNSWRLGSSANFLPDENGEKYWYTDITAFPSPREHSWITSPCFDFRGTEKPTLVTRIQRLFANNRDGSNLEYSTNDGQTWIPVGSIYDGLNWFNSYFGNPGEQAEGWSSITDNGWVEARHVLDFLIGEPKVQFRINYFAFGSATENKGLAIDDFEIVKRNRTVLIEHFTNSSCMKCVTADSLLDLAVQQSGNNVIDIRYHTNDDSDPLYMDNPVIPSARLFYYGITGIPYSIVNGGSLAERRLDYITKKPEVKEMNIESLYDSDFNLQVVSMLQADTLYCEVIITSLKDLPRKELTVHMIVIEPLIDNIIGENGTTLFRNVVKAMLPDAAGNVLYKSWTANESVSIRQAWPLTNVYNAGDLRIAGFVQDETSHEVYQASLDARGVVSGNDELIDKPESFTVFPNPANDKLFVEFDESPEYPVIIEIYNVTGSLVLNQKQNGSSLYEIDISSLTPGVYFLKLTADYLHIVRTPVVVH